MPPALQLSKEDVATLIAGVAALGVRNERLRNLTERLIDFRKVLEFEESIPQGVLTREEQIFYGVRCVYCAADARHCRHAR